MADLALEWRLALVDVVSFYERAGLDAAARPTGFRLTTDALFNEEARQLALPVRLSVLSAEASDPAAVPDNAGDEWSPDVMASVEIVVVFEFRDLEAARDVAGELRLPRAQVISALGIALATARGVLVGRARHPVFSRAVLPILSPRDEFDKLIDVSDKPWIAAE